MVDRVFATPMYRLPSCRWFFMFLILSFFPDFSRAQRIFLPPTPDSTPPAAAQTTAQAPPTPPNPEATSLIVKTYPDGTKKIVPLESLNFHDDGQAFGGPPSLSVYEGPVPNTAILSQKSAERLAVAPIGASTDSASLTANLPASADPLAGATQVAAADPMGGGAANPMGGGPMADPLGGGASAAPVDPLSGSAPKNAPPLQTVSGKPAPIVGDATMVELGAWDSFFLNAGIGGSLQGQLTARRVWNGTNRQAYPFPVNRSIQNLSLDGQIHGENFTFQPGFRFDVEFGYNFYEWLGVGLQTGVIYNGLQNYSIWFSGDLSYPGAGTISGTNNSWTFPADGQLMQVPIQLAGILRWPGQVAFRPFIGGGIGAIWQQLDVNSLTVGIATIPGNYCRSAFQFGWNAQLGATYTVEPGVDFYGAFKMLSAFTPVIGNYQFENTYNFAVEVGIQSRF